MTLLKKGMALLMVVMLVGCGQPERFAGRYAITPGGAAQFRISTNGNLYVLEKYSDGTWNDRRELGQVNCPEEMRKLQKTLTQQRPILVCLGRGGEVAAALLYLDAPRDAWRLAHYYLIIGMPLPLYKIKS